MFQLEITNRRREGISVFDVFIVERGTGNYTMYFYDNQLEDIDILAKEYDVSRRVIAYTMVAKFAQRLYDFHSPEQQELMPKLKELELHNEKGYESLLAQQKQDRQNNG
jgi:hypothetical protein